MTKEWLESQIKMGKFLTHIAEEQHCSKDLVSRLIGKYGLRELYDETMQSKNKHICFRINNPELKAALEKYGPLYNVVN